MRCAAASLNMTSSAAEALPRNSSAAMRLPPARVARFTLQARLAPLQSGGKPGMEGKHLHSWRSCACRTPDGALETAGLLCYRDWPSQQPCK